MVTTFDDHAHMSAARTRGDLYLWDKRAGYLATGPRGGRRIGGVNPVQALVRNYGNQGLDAKGEVQVAKAIRREYRC